MLPTHMNHPFVDRYRDAHNASPRSLVDEDTMNPPSSGTAPPHPSLYLTMHSLYLACNHLYLHPPNL